jgi:hypothetical protein
MTAAAPAWQRGYDLALLKGWAQLFQAFDGDLCLGAFTKVKETQIADWLSREQLAGSPSGWAVAAYRPAGSRLVKDFTGQPRVRVPAGALVVKRAAWVSELGEAAVRALLLSRGPLLWEAFAEHERCSALAAELGLERYGSKVRASSELVALYGRGCIQLAHADEAAEAAGIAPLSLRFDPAPLRERASQLQQLFVDHYSAYNERRSWQALALRSFGGSPSFIEKPAEMSKGWKAANSGALQWPCADTDLRACCPEVEPLLAPLGQLERVRLMALQPGGGLARHADITDRDAGVRDGKLMRIHFPLRSAGCEFNSWQLDGSRQTCEMLPGRAYYLDTRKPHAAYNRGSDLRVHLVADAYATRALRSLLEL